MPIWLSILLSGITVLLGIIIGLLVIRFINLISNTTDNFEDIEENLTMPRITRIYEFATGKGTAVAQKHVCCCCENPVTIYLDRNKLNRYRSGEDINIVFAKLAGWQRELIETGIHPECMKKLVK